MKRFFDVFPTLEVKSDLRDYFKETEIVVTDFTKIFLTPILYKAFVRGGGKISVMQKSKLIAVTVNPTAPNGMVLDSDRLCKTMSEAINLPVYDLKKCD